MGRHCIFVMGPAGSGKSTLCSTLITHMEASKRRAFLMNLDPAAENFEYKPNADIRSLISLDDVMDALELGPNGGLVYCLEYLYMHLDWLHEALGPAPDDDYWIVDCPGQIELYCHSPVMKNIITYLQQSLNFSVAGVYCVDSGFVGDPTKYISASLTAMSAMIQLSVPHINVLTKIDLLKPHMNEEELEQFLWPGSNMIDEWSQCEKNWRSEKWKNLNKAVSALIDSYDMVSYTPLDISDEDSVDFLLQKIDMCTQYGEDAEPVEPKEYNEVSND